MRTWFITGVGSGLGKELTGQVLARGERVLGTVRRQEQAVHLRHQYPERLDILQAEMTDLDRLPSVVDRAFAETERIDVIVNNAGYGLFGPVESLSAEQIRHQIDTNLMAPMVIAKAAIPHLRAQRGGRIVQISTYGGQAAHPGSSLYHASKWGIEGFMESMAGELAPFEIGVTIVEPGSARTGFRANAGAMMGQRLQAYDGTPGNIAYAVLQGETRAPLGDPVRMAEAIIASIDTQPAPLRLVLGTDSFTAISKALTDRLAEVTAQKNAASLTDFPPA